MKIQIRILDSFILSKGIVYIIQFLDGVIPLTGLRFVYDGVEWGINGVRWPKFGDDEHVWDCMISAVSGSNKELPKVVCAIEIINEEYSINSQHNERR